MERRIIKPVSIILAVLTVFSAVPLFSFAASAQTRGDFCDCGFSPTVYVQGVNTKDIYKDVESEDRKVIFPPSGEDIKSAVLDVNLFTCIGKYLVTRKWKYIGDALIGPVNSVFDDAACDNSGNPKEGTGIDWDYRTAYIKDSANHRDTQYATFYYDWRLDPMEIAVRLDGFIQRVSEHTGHEKVNLIGFSMGSVIVMSYIAQFGYDALDGVLFSAPAFNGTVTCGEPFVRMIEVDGIAVARFMDDMLKDDEQSRLIKTLVNLLYKTKVLDGVGLFVDKLLEEQGDRVYDEVMLTSLVTMPGLWSLIPADLYDKAKQDLLVGDERFTELIARIDNYDNNVRKKGDELIAGLFDRGINFGVISKYGSQLTPCIEGWDLMGDSVIDTKGASFGAFCSSLEGTLGAGYTQKVQCGHSHVSPDNQIDASTCKYPEYTWFVRELLHSHSCADYDKISYHILYSEEQVTVRDSAEFPQFMLYNKDDESIVPMTVDNCALNESIADYSLLRTIKDFCSSLVGFIKSRNK